MGVEKECEVRRIGSREGMRTYKECEERVESSASREGVRVEKECR